MAPAIPGRARAWRCFDAFSLPWTSAGAFDASAITSSRCLRAGTGGIGARAGLREVDGERFVRQPRCPRAPLAVGPEPVPKSLLVAVQRVALLYRRRAQTSDSARTAPFHTRPTVRLWSSDEADCRLACASGASHALVRSHERRLVATWSAARLVSGRHVHRRACSRRLDGSAPAASVTPSHLGAPAGTCLSSVQRTPLPHWHLSVSDAGLAPTLDGTSARPSPSSTPTPAAH